jgi:hypothetical protein
MTPPSGHLRKLREQRESRRLGVAKILRETPNATNVDLAKVFKVNRDTIQEDRQHLMTLAKNETLTETQLYRDNQLSRVSEKWDEIESDDTMTGAEKHLAWSRWMKLEMDLRGTAAPSRSENLNVNADVEAVGPFRKWVRATRGLNEQQVEQLLLAAEKTPRKPFAMVEPPKTSPLWNKNQLTEGDHEVA